MKKNLSYLSMLIFLLGAAAFIQYLARASEHERVPARTPLAELPLQLDSWRQVDAQTLGAGQIRELKADDFISRTYADNRGFLAYLFIAYYASQRHRQTIHSPQGCMPGSGWIMSNHRAHSIGKGQNNEERQVNEYLIEKDGVKMLAFYWYHGRGRVVASDYWGRFYNIKDSIFSGRTDGALVRVIVPLGGSEEAVQQARNSGLEFSKHLLGIMSSYIPD
ncbi:MAG: EpsI family protein [Acidobacteria bacterium]|nr:EpsI family protein [Acidobacteriota bacterium]